MVNLRQWIIALAAVLASSLLLAPPAAAAKEPDCTPAQAKEADKLLWLNRRDKRISLKQHLPWGVPEPTQATSNEHILIHWDYVIRHDDDLRVPVWTAERVVGGTLGKAKRSDCFRADPRLPATAAASDNDYKEPIFDQGHMTPSANVTTSKTSVWNSFIMSNMTPQFCQFNRGIWQILEELVRRWSSEHGTVHVVNGSIFDRDGDGLRDLDSAALLMRPRKGSPRVAIPSAFYKVIAIGRTDGSVQTISFLLPHDQADLDGQAAIDYLNSKVVPLATIEGIAGLDFLPQARAINESATLWAFQGRPPRSLARIGTQCRSTAGAIIR